MPTLPPAPHPEPALGFAISGGVGLDASTETRLATAAVDAGLGPVFLTEVAGAAATSVAAAVAARRPGHVLGTGIVPLGSRTAATLAMEATSVASISKTPFLLGVGVSTQQIVGDWHRTERRATLSHTASTIADLRALLDGQRRGSFRLGGATEAEVRILLGTLGPRMTELACTVADGALLTLTPPDAIPDLTGTQSYVYMWVRACEDADVRTRREITSYATAAPYARHFATLGYGAVVEQLQQLHSEGRLREGPDVVPQDLLDLLFVDAADVAQRTDEYTRVGITPVVMPVTGVDPEHDVRKLLTQLKRAGSHGNGDADVVPPTEEPPAGATAEGQP